MDILRSKGSPFSTDYWNVFRRSLSCALGMGFTKRVVETALEEGVLQGFWPWLTQQLHDYKVLTMSLICKMKMVTYQPQRFWGGLSLYFTKCSVSYVKQGILADEMSYHKGKEVGGRKMYLNTGDKASLPETYISSIKIQRQ